MNVTSGLELSTKFKTDGKWGGFYQKKEGEIKVRHFEYPVSVFHIILLPPLDPFEDFSSNRQLRHGLETA